MFPKDHFCVVSHDFFLADPGAALEVVARFYGLAEYDWRALVQRYKFHWSNHKSLVCVTSLGCAVVIESTDTRAGGGQSTAVAVLCTVRTGAVRAGEEAQLHGLHAGPLSMSHVLRPQGSFPCVC